MRRVRSVITQPPELGRICRPAGTHLHPQAQHHVFADQSLDVDACLLADRFEARPTFPDHDRLLSIPFDIYGSFYSARCAALSEPVDADRRSIRQLVADLTNQFLANDLCSHEPLGTIRDLVGVAEM